MLAEDLCEGFGVCFGALLGVCLGALVEPDGAELTSSVQPETRKLPSDHVPFVTASEGRLKLGTGGLALFGPFNVVEVAIEGLLRLMAFSLKLL